MFVFVIPFLKETPIHTKPPQEQFGKRTLWTSVYQLEAIAKKLGNQRKEVEEIALYIIEGSVYMWKHDKHQPSAYSTRSLTGKGMSSTKGTADFWILKFGILQRLFGFVEMSAMTSAQKDLVKNSFSSWKAFQEYHQPQAEQPDLSWMQPLPEQVKPLMELLQGICYDTKYDPKARAHVGYMSGGGPWSESLCVMIIVMCKDLSFM